MNEVKEAIRFYDKRGWDWLSVVEFLCWRLRMNNGAVK